MHRHEDRPHVVYMQPVVNSFSVQHFPSINPLAAYLCKHAESKHSTVMSSVTPQQSDGNPPQPHPIVSTHGGVNRLAFLPDG